jgi:hypothetical protein
MSVPTAVTQAFLTLAAHRMGLSVEAASAVAAEMLELFSRADRVVVVVDGVEKTVIEKAPAPKAERPPEKQP